MSTATEHCSLCGMASHFLVASPWGQVHKHCLARKGARAGAEARAATVAAQPSQGTIGDAASNARFLQFLDSLTEQRERERAERLAREAALHEEGRQEGIREATEAAVRLLRTQSVLHRAKAREYEAQGHPVATVGRVNAFADILDVAAREIGAGEHLRKEGT